MEGLKIGSTELRHGLVLAPMAGVTDKYFRRLCASCGAEYAVTEMVSAKAICYEMQARSSAAAKTAHLANIERGTIPTSVQIFGSDPDFMAEAARLIESRTYNGADGAPTVAIDINMGCPVRKVVSCGEGSALMKNPRLAERIVETVKKSVNIPVTVKIRAGWDQSSINAPELSKMLEAAGADVICVHGRTREQFYAPSSDNKVIAAVKKSVKIPVIGNGDINTASDALRMLDETECDGVMLARGILGNPWLFSEIVSALEGSEYMSPKPSEKIEAALEHTKSVIAEKGQSAVAEAKGQLAWYVKGIRGAAEARDKIHSASSFEEMEQIMLDLAIRSASEENL